MSFVISLSRVDRFGRPGQPAALALSVLVFAWPELSLAVRGVPASYALVSAILTLVVVAVVVGWPRSDDDASGAISQNRVISIVAVVAAAVVIVAAYRWTHLAAWQPYHADMLIVIREATRRFLNGHTPYATYRSYDAAWDMAMPYGPALWGPYLAPQLLRVDFRMITIIGQLFAPVWCGVAAVANASRGRIAAASWLAVLAALVLALDVQRFTLIGHTPVYWPLFLPLAVMIERRRWIVAACLLGVLVAARTTMVVIVPVFLMGVWRSDRGRFAAVLIALTITIAAALAPFVAWDARAIWESMILSYPRVMKAAVWPVLARPGLETIGVTEWLIERHRESLVTPVQVVAMTGVYAAAWAAIGRARRPLPWMALALFAFSMTTLYPVHYLYYDVLLLLVSGALAETLNKLVKLDEGPVRLTIKAWGLSLMALAALVFLALRAVASPFPHVTAGEVSPERPLRAGFAAAERDGARDFSWIVGHEARIVLPRSSAAAADIVLTAQSPFDGNQPPQRMAAILNGTLLTETTIPAGWREIRIAAPRSAWWAGFNELRLLFSSTVAPREVGAGDDPRPLALALSRVDVVTRKE